METPTTQPTPSKEWQELKTKIEALCDEQEKIYQPQFEAIFTALYELEDGQRVIYNTNGWNMGQPLPDKADEGLIAQAINKAGFAKKKSIAEGFLRYANTVIKGKRLQVEMALQNAKELTPPQPAVVAGWVFKPFANIIAPMELHSTINKVVADEALKGVFDSTTDIADESIDVLLDELMMAEAFNIPCSLTHYTEELKRYNLILGQNSFFDRDCTRLLLATLKEAVLSLKEYTDQPNRLKKAIADIVKRFDDVKVWGIFFQILVLQGLCDMLERLDINEGESGYDEAQAFYNWLIEELCKKGWWFACVSSMAYGDGDLLRFEPLCAYLMSTTAGQLVQKALNNDKTTDTLSDERADAQQLPDELNTDRANKYFEKAIKAGIINYNKGRYGKEANITKAQLAYFLEKVFCPNNTDKFPEQALNILFNESRLGKARGANIDNKDGKPRGYERIDEVFKE